MQPPTPNHTTGGCQECHDSSYPILLGDDGDLGNEHSHGSLLEAHGGERCDQHRCPGTPQRGAPDNGGDGPMGSLLKPNN